MVRVGERPAMICVGGSPSQARDRSPTHPSPPPPNTSYIPQSTPQTTHRKPPQSIITCATVKEKTSLGPITTSLGVSPLKNAPKPSFLTRSARMRVPGVLSLSIVVGDCVVVGAVGLGNWSGGRCRCVWMDGWRLLHSIHTRAPAPHFPTAQLYINTQTSKRTTHLKSRFWMRVLITSRGCATVMEATAPATLAIESCMKVASEYFSSC